MWCDLIHKVVTKLSKNSIKNNSYKVCAYSSRHYCSTCYMYKIKTTTFNYFQFAPNIFLYIRNKKHISCICFDCLFILFIIKYKKNILLINYIQYIIVYNLLVICILHSITYNSLISLYIIYVLLKNLFKLYIKDLYWTYNFLTGKNIIMTIFKWYVSIFKPFWSQISLILDAA